MSEATNPCNSVPEPAPALRIADAVPAPAGAVSPEQIEAITDARRRASRISRAAGVATFSGWTMAIFAGITLLSGIFSLRALLLGIALSVVAYVELRGARDLRRLELFAPRRLAINQIGLALAVVIYASWGIAAALFGPGSYEEQLATAGPIADTFEPIDRLTRTITVGFYTLVIGASIVAQGCAAVYYFSRRRHIADYLHSTPPWLVQTLRAAA